MAGRKPHLIVKELKYDLYKQMGESIQSVGPGAEVKHWLITLDSQAVTVAGEQ